LKMPPTVRKRLIVRGKIQHVGYRALVMAYAGSMGIRGFARNLPDMSVEVVCEGEPGAVAGFIKAIDRKGDPLDPMSINVVSIEEAPPPPGGEFSGFTIDYGRELTPVERESLDRDEIMILGAGALNMKMDTIGEKVEEVGRKVEAVGDKVDGVGRAVRGMHTDMNRRFDQMAKRYDLIAASLVKAIDRMDRGFNRMDRASKRTERAVDQSRREVAKSNRELARAVSFMIMKLSGRPPRRKGSRKRRR